MPDLMLVGVVHLDPGGGARLDALLRVARPAVVALELSPYAVAFREARGAALARRLEPFRAPSGALPPALEAVAAQLALPFELSAARAYAAEAGAGLRLLGDSGTSRLLLSRFEAEVLDPRNLATLAAREEQPLAARVAAAWARARRERRRPAPVGTRERLALEDMDARLAAGIRDALAASRSGGVVHVGGWEHLLGLSRALADLEPGCRPLDR